MAKTPAWTRKEGKNPTGVKGPATKPNGEPTRKTLALRKWNC